MLAQGQDNDDTNAPFLRIAKATAQPRYTHYCTTPAAAVQQQYSSTSASPIELCDTATSAFVFVRVCSVHEEIPGTGMILVYHAHVPAYKMHVVEPHSVKHQFTAKQQLSE